MSFRIRKIRNKDEWKVVNTDTGEVNSQHVTRENAEVKIKLLGDIQERVKKAEAMSGAMSGAKHAEPKAKAKGVEQSEER